MMNMKESYYFQ